MEKELKLQVTSGKAAQVLHAPAISRFFADAPDGEQLASTYFDTDDLFLRQKGASLRVRAIGDQRVQALKLDGSVSAGLFERDEFECPTHGDVPDLASLNALIPSDSKAAAILGEEGLSERLQPIFVTRIHRTASLLRLPAGSEVEVAIDDGAVEIKTGASNAIHGVELELKAGPREQLYALALELMKDVPLRIDHLSKADRGYQLLVHQPTAPVRAAALKLSKRASVEAAFQTITRNCLTQVHGNERGVVYGHDPSSVHQMRVGLRRLRSALDLFAPVITAPADFDEELRWIARELGHGRDWEVLSGATLEGVFGHTDDDADATVVRQRGKRHRHAEPPNGGRGCGLSALHPLNA